MKVKKVSFNKWTCGDWTIVLSHNKIKGLHPKYHASYKRQGFYANTLKEAQTIIEEMETE